MATTFLIFGAVFLVVGVLGIVLVTSLAIYFIRHPDNQHYVDLYAKFDIIDDLNKQGWKQHKYFSNFSQDSALKEQTKLQAKGYETKVIPSTYYNDTLIFKKLPNKE